MNEPSVGRLSACNRNVNVNVDVDVDVDVDVNVNDACEGPTPRAPILLVYIAI